MSQDTRTEPAAGTEPESVATDRSLDAIFRPHSIAVIGASPRPGTIGRQVLENLIRYEYTGMIFPVNPKHSVVLSFKCYPSVTDIPDPVSLAFIIVPRDAVLDTIDQCAACGIRGVVVITAGFREVGPEGARLEELLLDRLRRHRMRMIGPNCFGIVNTEPEFRVNGTFGKTLPIPGRIALVSQSGALGETILTQAGRLGIGFSMFASVGNKTDVSGNVLLEYWQDDPHTDVILMYLENFGDPRRFVQIARRITRTKPVVVVKAGRTAAGARAALSHTGALAGKDASVDALFEQTGVIRVSSIQEMFDVAMALVSQPLPKGNRVCVVTNAGGPGILATDSLAAHGLRIATLSEETRATLSEKLPRQASVQNPVDLIASADGERYGFALEAVTRDEGVDCVVPIFVPPLMIDAEAVAEKIVEVATAHRKPTLPCMMGVEEHAPWVHILQQAGLPVYPYPEDISLTLAAMERWRRWRERPQGAIPVFTVDHDAVRMNLERRSDHTLHGAPALALLEAYGIPTLASEPAASAEEAMDSARRLGFPVALKLISPQVLHKSDVGGVRLDLRTAGDVREAFESIKRSLSDSRPEAQFDGVEVQPLLVGGTELVVGVTTDAHFGPLVMFGLGGLFVEVTKDVVFRVHPLTDRDANEMIRQIRGFPLLQGIRGRDPVDLDALAEILLRVSQLVSDEPSIDQIDINPLLSGAGTSALKAVDARIIFDGASALR